MKKRMELGSYGNALLLIITLMLLLILLPSFLPWWFEILDELGRNKAFEGGFIPEFKFCAYSFIPAGVAGIIALWTLFTIFCMSMQIVFFNKASTEKEKEMKKLNLSRVAKLASRWKEKDNMVQPEVILYHHNDPSGDENQNGYYLVVGNVSAFSSAPAEDGWFEGPWQMDFPVVVVPPSGNAFIPEKPTIPRQKHTFEPESSFQLYTESFHIERLKDLLVGSAGFEDNEKIDELKNIIDSITVQQQDQ